VSLAQAVMEDYQWNLRDLRLVPGGKGIFDVHLDDQLLFSKHSEHRFPEYPEIREQLVGWLGEPPEHE
jgi:selT/selW/selH-like putative selenoprotein